MQNTRRDLLPDPEGYDKVIGWPHKATEEDDGFETLRLVIVGSSGTGKTRAMLDMLSHEKAKEPQVIKGKKVRILYPVFNSINTDRFLRIKERCAECDFTPLDMIEDMKNCKWCIEQDDVSCPFDLYCPSAGAIVGVDDLQYFSGKKQLQFLYTLFEHSSYTVVTIQIPQAMPPGKVRSWLLQRWEGQQGQYRAEAEKVIRTLFEPGGLTVIQMGK